MFVDFGNHSLFWYTSFTERGERREREKVGRILKKTRTESSLLVLDKRRCKEKAKVTMEQNNKERPRVESDKGNVNKMR